MATVVSSFDYFSSIGLNRHIMCGEGEAYLTSMIRENNLENEDLMKAELITYQNFDIKIFVGLCQKYNLDYTMERESMSIDFDNIHITVGGRTDNFMAFIKTFESDHLKKEIKKTVIPNRWMVLEIDD